MKSFPYSIAGSTTKNMRGGGGLTGTAQVQGGNYAICLAHAGADVIDVHSTLDGAARSCTEDTATAVRAVGRRIIAVTDVCDVSGRNAAVSEGIDAAGPVDFVIGNAAVTTSRRGRGHFLAGAAAADIVVSTDVRKKRWLRTQG